MYIDKCCEVKQFITFISEVNESRQRVKSGGALRRGREAEKEMKVGRGRGDVMRAGEEVGKER